MQNPIQDYFHLLGVGKSSPDPTIPFDNDFHLLGLDESDSDRQIAQKAKAAASVRSQEVDKRGQANASKRLDILLRDKINQAGARFDGNEAKVREHRDELQRARTRRLKDIARDLCDSGKWTEEQGVAMLQTLANAIGVAPDRLDGAVSEAIQSAGQWSAPSAPAAAPVPAPAAVAPPPPPSPTPPPAVVFADRLRVANLEIPLWPVLPVVGLGLGIINGWAGLAFGLTFLVIAWGKANAERKANPGAASNNNLKWGLINASIASAPLLALLILHPGADSSPARWGGDWDTDWGKMTFTGESGHVTAKYEAKSASGKIDLKSTSARQLDGSWCLGSCASPNETGRLRLVLDEDGKAFKGWFTYGLDSPIPASADADNQISGRRKISP